MSSRSPADYRNRIETDLRRNILPFWIDRVVNRESGSFIGSLTNDLVADPAAERGMLLTARILWTYAAAYTAYRDPTYLAMADLACADLFGRFHDQNHGGFWWSIAADGTVLRVRKQIYGQAFAIYALAEYHAAPDAENRSTRRSRFSAWSKPTAANPGTAVISKRSAARGRRSTTCA